MARSPEEIARMVSEYFVCIPGEDENELTIAFRGDTETGNAGTSGVRTVSIAEAELIGQGIIWAVMEARQYVMDAGLVERYRNGQG